MITGEPKEPFLVLAVEVPQSTNERRRHRGYKLLLAHGQKHQR
jgi:hypothetical protein